MIKQDFEIDPEADEPPLLTSVRDYWTKVRSGRVMPRRSDIDPTQLKPQLPSVLLVDVIGKGVDFRYRLVGSRLQDYFAGNPTGKLMSEALAPFGRETVERTIEVYRTVVNRKAPLRVRGAGSYFGQGAKLFDALFTPLSDDNVDANMVFGTFTFVWDKDMTLTPRLRDPGEADFKRALMDR